MKPKTIRIITAISLASSSILALGDNHIAQIIIEPETNP